MTEASGETVNLTLSAPTGATLGTQSTAVLTITDAPTAGTLAFSAATYSVNEGGATVTITVQRVGGSVGDVTVDYATAPGTATAADYTVTSGTLTWLDGVAAAQTFTVAITQDALVEGDQSFTIALSNPTNFAAAGGNAAVTIVDDDATVAFAASASSVTEGTPGSVDITVTRSGGTAAAFTVNYATSAGTADAGDFLSSSGVVTFGPTVLSRTFSVPILNDSIVETASETFTVTLSAPVASVGTVALGAQTTNAVTILDDDTTFAFSAATYAGAENAGAITITVTVTRSGNVANATAQTVQYASAANTATAGTDYTTVSGTLTFAVGDVSETFTLTPIGDTTAELDETVDLALSLPSANAMLGAQATAVLTITNDDTNVQFSAATFTGAEGGAATTITITRIGVTTPFPSTVIYATSNGSATAGLDYTATTSSLTFFPGQTTQTFTVSSMNDPLVEGDETVNLTLSDPSGATLGTQSTALLTISDANAPAAGVLQFSAATFAQAEGNAGTATITVTVTRTGGTSGAVDVTWTTSNGSAAAGSDYTAGTGLMAFNVGEAAKTFTVTIAGDTTAEANETVNLTLSAATGGSVIGTQSTAVIQITNDDGAVPVPVPVVVAAAASDDSGKCGGGSGIGLLLMLLVAGAWLMPPRGCATSARPRR